VVRSQTRARSESRCANGQTVPRLQGVLNQAVLRHPDKTPNNLHKTVSRPASKLLFASSLHAKSSAASVFIDKHDSCTFEGASHYVERGSTRLADSGLKLIDRHDAYPSFFRQFVLVPAKKSYSTPSAHRPTRRGYDLHPHCHTGKRSHLWRLAS
jgi:hypothetical protein